MSANYTTKKLSILESETHDELALGKKEIKNGWNVSTLPSGEAIITLGLDYILNDKLNWNATTCLLNLSENLPTNLFSEISSCECHATDISSTNYQNTIICNLKQFASVGYTGIWTLYPLETQMKVNGYSLPTKIHVEWKVRGIKQV